MNERRAIAQTNEKSVEPLKDRVAELLRRQVEFAFDGGLFHLEPGEYLVVNLTLRADTNENIRRRYNVEFEIHV